jgi:hypothetical protein
MITELDETIKQILMKQAALEPSEVDIAFNTPNREWSASLAKPTVNLYLYDIRENHELRGTEWIIEKNGNNTATKRKNAKRINLSYLVTVWANNIEDQHRLLWRVLSALIRYPTIPPDLLSGQLAKQDYPVISHAAQPDGLFSNPADFWAALDNEIKPSFNYVVTLPLDLDITFTSAITRTREFSVKRPDGEAETITAISGIVRLKGKTDKVVAGATVVARDANMTSRTDEKGQYIFNRIPSGKQTFQVVVQGEKPKEIVITVPGDSYDIEI